MKKLVYLSLAVLAVLFHGMQIASAYHQPYGREYNFDFENGIYYRDYNYIDDYYGRPIYKVYYTKEYDYDDGYRFCKYFDYNDLKYRRDRVCEWVNQGDFRERVLRARAVNFIDESYNARYDSNYYKDSGLAFDYDFPAPKSETQFRNRLAFDPYRDAIDGKNYYYKPQKDSNGVYNWRF